MMRRVCAFTVGADHPALPGHFPGRPIVPGVMLLDEVLAAIAAGTGLRGAVRLERVKFASPVGPGEEVAVLLGPVRDGAVGFACVSGERRVLAGTAAYRAKGA
jgi:3-hydroxymyristoyl/3-hydroxydecanoyl-(acyl carrier protein) dehydratase